MSDYPKSDVHGRVLFAWAVCLPLEFRGMVRRVPRGRWRSDPTIPFGWCKARCWHRNAWLVMPLWFLPVYWLSRNWQCLAYKPLIRLGLYALDEGDYYVNGRWQWAQDWSA